KVWPHVLHWNTWVDAKQFVPYRVAGQADSEGEIKAVSHFDETGRMDHLSFLKTIKIVPNKQLVIKLLSPQYNFDPKTAQSSEFIETGYEVFTVYDKNGHTVMSLDALFEQRIPGISETEVSKIVRDYHTYTESNWYNTYFPNLKKLVAKS